VNLVGGERREEEGACPRVTGAAMLLEEGYRRKCSDESSRGGFG